MESTDLNTQIAKALTIAYKMRASDDGLKLVGDCPECGGRNELSAALKNRWALVCASVNRCGFQRSARAAVPDVFVVTKDRFPPTPESPTATADEYLSRQFGFSIKPLEGWYSQADYYDDKANSGSAVIRFYLSSDKAVHYDYFLNPVIKGKQAITTHYVGDVRNNWWLPPGDEIQDKDTVFLTDTCFEAIALNLKGFIAVSIMGRDALPIAAMRPYFGRKVKWVFALGRDEHSLKTLRDFKEKLAQYKEKLSAALPTVEGMAWAELYQADRLSNDDIEGYLALGDIELAPNARQKAFLIWQKNQKRKAVFAFQHQTYTAKLDPRKYDMHINEHRGDIEGAYNAGLELTVSATFEMQFLYYQMPEQGEEGMYFFRFLFPGKEPDGYMAYTKSQLASATEFKKQSLVPYALFTGTTSTLNELFKQWMPADSPVPVRRVVTIDYLGYSKKHKAYVYKDYAVQNGRIIQRNNEDFFQLDQIGIKTISELPQELSIKKPKPFIQDYMLAFCDEKNGNLGLILLAGLVGTWFAEQIREKYEGFPFFIIHGPASTGKNQLFVFLFKLCGMPYEGFNLSMLNATGKGIARKIASYSNLPVLSNESESQSTESRAHVKKSTWEDAKPWFEKNGQIGLSAAKSIGLKFHQWYFKAGMFITQNIDIFDADKAFRSRLVGLEMTREHHSNEGYHATQRLNALNAKDVSGFMLETLKKEADIMALIDSGLNKHLKTVKAEIPSGVGRILYNHALTMALLDCLPLLVDVSRADLQIAKDKVVQMAVAREAEQQEAPPMLQSFWEAYDYMEGLVYWDSNVKMNQTLQVNHSAKKDVIAIYLPHFLAMCDLHNRRAVFEVDKLKVLLANCEKPKCLGVGVSTYSTILKDEKGKNKSPRCFIFEAPK
jgi:hypothetical protein